MIMGHASAAEVEDLVKAKDYTRDQLQKAWEAFSPTWAGRNGAAVEDFRADFRALNKRYEDARRAALLRVEEARVQGRAQSGLFWGLLAGPLGGLSAASPAPDLR